MKQNHRFILIICMLFQFSQTLAQQGTVIRGQVTDKSTGDPLPGVNIVEMGAQNRIIKGVTTDINGNYVFNVNNVNHTIQVSFVGYH